MPQETFIEKQEENIAIHIFEVSAAMVGVCLTVIGLLSITSALTKIKNIGDELISFDAILFLVSCVISYTALKTKSKKPRYILEKTADIFFLIGLALVAITCILIAWEFI